MEMRSFAFEMMVLLEPGKSGFGTVRWSCICSVTVTLPDTFLELDEVSSGSRWAGPSSTPPRD
jgi:hypothetical protein